MTEVNEVYAGTRKEWRAWLKENHKKKKKVALISYKKHTGKPSISHKESMGEAICFGWIDTTLKRLDEDRYLRYFVRRNDNSKWSQNTLRYGQEMIKKRKMAAEGLRRYNQGLKKPVHDHGIPKNPKTPDYLKKALGKRIYDASIVFDTSSVIATIFIIGLIGILSNKLLIRIEKKVVFWKSN